MQIVIELDKDEFKDFVDNGKPISMNRLCGALFHGIPLPEKHGRLIDADKLYIKMATSGDWRLTEASRFVFTRMIKNAPAIVSAAENQLEDKEAENDD